MPQFVRRTFPEIVAIAKAHNTLCADAIVVGGTFFHADISGTPAGDLALSPTTTNLQVTAPNAADLPSCIVLANQIKGILVGAGLSTSPGAQPGVGGHLYDGINLSLVASGAHKIADVTNGPNINAIAAAVDLPTVQTLANQLKTSFNAHLTQAGVHFNNDGTNTVAASNASDLPTSITLLNAIKSSLNAHIISAPGSQMLNVLPA